MLDDIARRAMQSHVKASLKKIPKKVVTEAAPEKVMQLNYKPSDTFVKARKQRLAEESRIYTWNTIKNAEVKSLDDIKEWNSEFKPGTKEHFKDFGSAMKYKFPDLEGGDNFVGFEEIYAKYEALGFSRTINGQKHRLKRTSVNSPRHKYANGPALAAQPQKQRNVQSGKDSKIRYKNIKNGFSTPEDKANFNRLNQEKARLNESIGRKGKTGTGGYVLEHDILQSSRYWKVNTIRKNSDATNVYNWNNTKWITYKGSVERHLKRLTGEPFAVRMNGTKDKLEIIYIDTDEVVGTIGLGQDYKTLFKQLVRDFA